MLDILVLVLLTLLEGFFVAAEIALVSIRRSRVDQLVEEGNGAARRVRRLLDDPGRFLAVSQLGLTVLGFFAAAFAAQSITERLQGVLELTGVSTGNASLIALVTVTRAMRVAFESETPRPPMKASSSVVRFTAA